MDQSPPHARMLAWRRERGLKQEDAARAARIPQGAWSFIERGERVPTLAQAFRLEKLTGVHAVEWLSAADLRIGRVGRLAA